MKRILGKSLKVILIIFVAIVLLVIISFVRHKICSSNEKGLANSIRRIG